MSEKFLLLCVVMLLFSCLIWLTITLPLGDVPEGLMAEIAESEIANTETGVE